MYPDFRSGPGNHVSKTRVRQNLFQITKLAKMRDQQRDAEF